MGRAAAERAFGITTKHVSDDLPTPTEGKLRDDLRGLLADHRVMLDSGFNVAVQQNSNNWMHAMARVQLHKCATGGATALARSAGSCREKWRSTTSWHTTRGSRCRALRALPPRPLTSAQAARCARR
jgi:hypothetical protein